MDKSNDKASKMDRQRRNLLQRRWRARQRAETINLEDQVAELSKQISDLEIYNTNLEARHKCLQRQSELVEALHLRQLPTADQVWLVWLLDLE